MKTKNVLMAFATIGLFAFASCNTPKTEEVKKESMPAMADVVQTPNIVGVARLEILQVLMFLIIVLKIY